MVPVLSVPSRVDMAQSTEFGVWLQSEMKRRGFNQSDMADVAGLTQVYISGLARGVRNPSRDAVKAIAAALAVDGADTDIVNRLVDEGLIAAGFAPEHSTYERARPDITAADKELLDLAKSDPLAAAMQLIERAKGQAPASSPVPEPVDTRSAAEKAQGVPVDNRPPTFQRAYAPPALPDAEAEERLRERMRQEERERDRRA